MSNANPEIEYYQSMPIDLRLRHLRTLVDEMIEEQDRMCALALSINDTIDRDKNHVGARLTEILEEKLSDLTSFISIQRLLQADVPAQSEAQ